MAVPMEIMPTPPHITSFQCFDIDAGMVACKHYLLEHEFESAPDLLGVVGVVLEVNPDDLCLQVCDMTQTVRYRLALKTGS